MRLPKLASVRSILSVLSIRSLMKTNARLFLGSVDSLRFFSEDVVRLVEYGVQLTRPELIGISKDGSISLHVHSIHVV